MSKVLLKVKKGKRTALKMEVKGLLVDRLVGVWHCSLSTDLSASPAKVNAAMVDYSGAVLISETLCPHLKTLLIREDFGAQ